jgi:hypothetical protein
VTNVSGEDGATALLATERVDADGSARFDVRGGCVYRFGAFDEGRGVVEDRAWIAREPAEVRRELVLPHAEPPARLALHLDEYPEPARRVHVATPSGVRLWSHRLAAEDEWSLPAGSYRVSVCDPPSVRSTDANALDEQALYESDVVLQAGETRSLALRF